MEVEVEQEEGGQYTDSMKATLCPKILVVGAKKDLKFRRRRVKMGETHHVDEQQKSLKLFSEIFAENAVFHSKKYSSGFYN